MKKLSFEDFVKVVQEKIGELLPKDYDGAQIEIRHVVKNNNITLTGLIINLPGCRVTPNIYLDYFYQSYLDDDMNIEEILQKIIEVRIQHSVPPEEFNLDELLDFEKVKDRIYPKLVNRDDNRDYLADKAFKPLANLAVVYQIDVGEHNDSMATITISEGILHNWNRNIDELHDIAVVNMKRDRQSVFLGMSEVLQELMGGAASSLTGSAEMMWILTNQRKYLGASAVLDDEIMERVCKQFDNRLYIIPSSIHELIIVPSDGMDPNQLLEIIASVNGTEVQPEDKLSGDLYVYDAEKRMLNRFVTG